MSDIGLRRLEQLRTGGLGDRMELAFPLPKSPKGRIQRYCPSHDCAPRRFQLGDAAPERQLATAHEELVRRKPGRPGITCPYCGKDGDDQSFTAPEDIEAAKKHIAWAVERDVSDYIESIAKNFNRQLTPMATSNSSTGGQVKIPHLTRL